MADMQKVIEMLSAGKADAGGNFASKTYQDEPILITAAQLPSYTPPKYREMRKMGIRIEFEPEAKIFYRQGKFMEDFEDDFDYRGQFARYFPTYQSMDDHQLRGYFSWRSKVRRGVIEKTQLSFAFVYIYELLNQIGVSSPKEGFHKLKNFRGAYGRIDSKIDFYVNLWLQDYVVYNRLDKSLIEDLPYRAFYKVAPVLLNHKAHDAETVFWALSFLSSYNFGKSRFFMQYPDDVKNVVYDVYSAIADYYGKDSLCEKFLGKIYTSSYTMFKSAVFYHRVDRNFVYEINDVHKYICENGNWSCERFYPYRGKSQQEQVGALLKNIDSYMRQKYNFKYTLKAEKTTKILQHMITEAIDYYRENKRKAALPKVEIDVSKLQDIRNAALEIQNKLTVEEFEETDATDAIEIFDENEQGNRTGLNDVELEFMNCLLYGKEYSGLVRSNGLMLSVLIDSINERLFDTFGDTVIIDDGEPALIEDYVDALKGIIKE